MTRKSKTQYALEFFGKSILLLSTQDNVTWSEIGLADMGDPDFLETMKDFHAEVSKQGLRKAKIALFLPLEDVALDTASSTNLSDDLEHQSGSPIEDLAFAAGSADDAGLCKILYAQRETLKGASTFISQYGFKPVYFSARIDLAGFEQQPQLYLAENRPYAVIGMWPAAVAALALGAFGLWSFSQNMPQATPRALQLSSVQRPVIQLPKAEVKNAAIRSEQSAIAPSVPEIPAALNAVEMRSDQVALPASSTASLAITEISTTQAPTVPAAKVALPKVTPNTDASLAATNNVATQENSAEQPSLINNSAAIPVFSDTTAIVDDTSQASLTDATATTLLNDLTREFPKPVLRDIDRAIPENADIPRPQLRSGKRIVTTTQSPETTTETVATTPEVATPETVVATPTPEVVAEPTVTIDPTISRPPKRSAQITAKAAADAAKQAIAQDLIDQEIKKEQELAAKLASASKRARGTSKRPPIKTANFRRLASNIKQPTKPATVTATATATTTKPKPTPKPKVTASAKPTPTKKTKPEPSTRASTTFNKRALSLVGVFGTKSRRSALFRTASGNYKTVKIGQRVAGWKVVSIGESSAKITKGSRSKSMRLPK